MQSFKPASSNAFADKNSLPNIQSPVPDKYLDYINNNVISPKAKVKNSYKMSPPTPQKRYQTPRDSKEYASGVNPTSKLFHFQGNLAPLSPITNTSDHKNIAKLFSPASPTSENNRYA